MPIELQMKLWEVLTAYQNHLLDDESEDGWAKFCEFSQSLGDVKGYEEFEDRMKPLWADNLSEL